MWIGRDGGKRFGQTKIEKGEARNRHDDEQQVEQVEVYEKQPRRGRNDGEGIKRGGGGGGGGIKDAKERVVQRWNGAENKVNGRYTKNYRYSELFLFSLYGHKLYMLF